MGTLLAPEPLQLVSTTQLRTAIISNNKQLFSQGMRNQFVFYCDDPRAR